MTIKLRCYYHLLGWLLFIAYEVSFVYFTTGRFARPLDYALYYLLNIALFYVNAWVMLPFAFSRPKLSWVWAAGLVIMELVIYLGIKYGLDELLQAVRLSLRSQMAVISRYLLVNLWRGLYFIGFSTAYWLTRRAVKAETDLAESQNAYHQHQINPHLLFNTLAFIHNTYYKFSREASQCVLLLAEIMRYSLEGADADGKTPLADEIEHIRDFIELNQLRFDFELYVDFSAEGNFEDLRVIPLILLTLTENVFKHGNLKSKAGAARLLITVNEQQELRFTSWNLKKHESGARRRRAIGIRNVIKRLAYSYPHGYTLDIRDEEEVYALELKIKL